MRSGSKISSQPRAFHNLTVSFPFGTLPRTRGAPVDPPCGGGERARRGSRGMIKSELIQKIAEKNPHLYHRDVERIINTVFDQIIKALHDGDRVELRGFGAFSVKSREQRVGRNPRTGDSVRVEAKRVPFFKTGKELRARLNPTQS